ncbi:MAG: SpoIIE family protein phosphatase [bacterium]
MTLRLNEKNGVNLAAIAVLILIGMVVILYSTNLYVLRSHPTVGFMYRKLSGWAIIGRIFDEGYKAGFRIGDKIVEVNGEPVESLESLRSNIDRTIGATNRFTILRDEEKHVIPITITPFGMRNVFLICGIPFFIAILIIAIGAFIFFTTPVDEKPWSFSFFCLCAGLVLLFFNHGPIRPAWLQIFELVGFCFLPATILHMISSFPLEIDEGKKKSVFRFFPYVPSVGLFLALSTFSLEGSAIYMRVSVIVYLLVSIMAFIGVLFYRYVKARFRLAKLKIRVVLLGFFIGVLLPLIEPVLNIFFNIYLIPNIDLATLPFMTFFPLFIGYAIAKHDLFEIDVFIKRTTGYILTTASIIGIYFLFICTTNQFLGELFHNQQIITLFFILLVVLFFNPLHNRIQMVVDRLFYRKKYDYTEPVKRLLNELTFVFEIDTIIEKLLQILTDIMFIENIIIFFHHASEDVYRPYTYKKNRIPDEKRLIIPAASPLVTHLVKEKREIGRDSVYENRELVSARKEILDLFDLFHAELIFPFFTHEKMHGFISLGKIKSGRQYNISDIETLRIIANQAAMALENNDLFQDKIEKQKLEEELKIAGEIQRRMLPEVLPHTRYFYLYPKITPAIEIGGDFYDFFELPSDEGKELGIVIGDVSGHGIPGALLMSAAHTICQTQALNFKDVGQVMVESNKLLVRETKKRSFVGLIYARLFPDKRITIANAGLPSPLYYNSRTKTVSFIENEGGRFPLGIADDPSYDPLTLTMEHGDIILFYTDGVVEIPNKKNEFFSFQRLRDTLERFAHLEPEEIYTNILSELKRFAGNRRFEDDMTLIFLKHVDAASFDTTLSLPVSAYNANIIAQCAESVAQLFSLQQDNIDQLKCFLDKVFSEAAESGNGLPRYKMVVSLLKFNSDFDDSMKKGKVQTADPSVDMVFKNMLQGTRYVGRHFWVDMIKREKRLEALDTSNIARIVVDFHH